MRRQTSSARAGASTLAELLAVGLPAVLMPYPFHRDQHQMRQARAVEAMGAAIVVEDRSREDATWRELGEVLEALMSDLHRLDELAVRARTAGRRDAADVVARAILELADRRTERRHAWILSDVDRGTPAA